MASRIESDIYVAGAFSATSITLPAGTVTDASVLAGTNIQATKLQHQHRAVYENESATTAVSEARVRHVVYGTTASVIAFKAGSVVANVGAATVTVDLKKNGTSILTAVITLNNSITAYSLVAASIASANLVAGDVLEVVTVATAGGGTLAKGVFAEITINELPQ